MFDLINKKTYRLLLIIALVASLFATLSALSGAVDVSRLNDKLGHAIMFFVLAFLSYHALKENYGIKTLIALSLFGLFIEIIQYYLPWRSFSWLDWLADNIGLLFYELIHQLKRVLLAKFKKGTQQ